MGGPAAGAAPQAIPIVGADRYITSVMAAQRFFTNPTAVGIASGVAFPDGLTGGAHIGKLGGPLLLTDPNALPGNVQTYLTSIKATLTQLFVYGAARQSQRLWSRDQHCSRLRAAALRLIVVAVAGVAGFIALPAGPAAADSAVRLGGEDRIETSVAISQASYPKAGSAQAVVLARADDFADALAGTPFAVHVGGPLLITGKAALDVPCAKR